MRRRIATSLVSFFLAGTLTVVDAAPVLADSGVTETATTTYVVAPEKGAIDVTIRLSIRNSKPDSSCGWGCTTRYHYNEAQIVVEAEAGAVKVTSDAGAVKQSVQKTTKYYRYVHLTYPRVYYGQTRTVTATYRIAATPDSAGSDRAGSAYVSLCVLANGYDSGSVSVVVPSVFDPKVVTGDPMPDRTTADAKVTLASGSLTDTWSFWSCIDGANPARLVSSSVSAGGQTFTLKSWPEDPAWATTVSRDVTADVQRLADLTGLSMPGGTITIQEVGNYELGQYVGLYDPKIRTVFVTEDLNPSDLAHELSHIWFNDTMFSATWMSEGFAGYGEKAAGTGNYEACASPGAYPGTGSPDLNEWTYIDPSSTTEDENVVTWDYAASCYVVTVLADTMGSEPFKDVVAAAAQDEIAYVGAPDDDSVVVKEPLTSRELLDLFDERGMIPAGIAELDQAQELFASYGIIKDAGLLEARSEARAEYHSLVSAAGAWKLPYAVRQPMAAWDFETATAALTTTRQILEMRDRLAGGGLSLDGTAAQDLLEEARTQADMDALLTLMEREVDAAAKYDLARDLRDNGANGVFEKIGLLGTDTAGLLDDARTALRALEPDKAAAAAQKVIDAVQGSGPQGLLRIGIVLGLLLFLAGLTMLFKWRRQRPIMVTVTAEALIDDAEGALPPEDLASAAPPPDSPAAG
jgi:hypothetical protein